MRVWIEARAHAWQRARRVETSTAAG